MAIGFMQLFGTIEIAKSKIRRRIIKANLAIFGNANNHPIITGTVKGNARNQQLTHRKTKCATAIRLFNAARQRAFTANA